MQLLGRVSIKFKVLGIVGAMAAAMGLGSALIAVNITNTIDNYDALVANDAQAAVLMTGANRNLQAMGYAAYQALVYPAGSPENVSAVKKFNENQRLYEDRLSQASELAPDQASDIDGLLARFKQVHKTFEQGVNAGAQDRNEDAKRLLAESDALVGPLTDDGQALAASLRDLLKQKAQKNADAADAMTMTIAIGSAFVIVLSLVFGYLVATAGITKPLERITARMRGLADGDTDTAIDGVDRGDEVGVVAKSLNVFRQAALENKRLEAASEAARSQTEQERIARESEKAKAEEEIKFAVNALAAGLSALSRGDLTQPINVTFVGSLEKLRTDFNGTLETLQTTLSKISESARSINSGASEIQSAANDLSKRTEQQAASVEETAAALEQITTTVKESTERAQDAGARVGKAKANAEASGIIVKRAIEAMGDIEDSSSEISNIIGVIDEIAFQTNLLALNAGVEAARAGDAGKGFAVVATEVRELAQRSANAAKEIKALIGKSSEKVALGVDLVGKTGDSLKIIVSEVQDINDLVAAIAQTSKEQSTGLAEVNTAVNHIDQNTQQNAAMVEQSNAASHNLAREANVLDELIANFKLQAAEALSHRRVERPRDEKPQSALKAMSAKLNSAFRGSAAVKSAADEWQEF